eukprot:441000-Rhodomonas_salina.3
MELPAYGLAMRCPVLRSRLLVPGMMTTAPMPARVDRSQVRLAVPGTARAFSGITFAHGTRCPVLRWCTVLDVVSGAIGLWLCYAMPGTDIAYQMLAVYLRPDEEDWRCSPLCAYAMSGTDLAYGAMRLCACYAMSGTDLAYAATRLDSFEARSVDFMLKITVTAVIELRPGSSLRYQPTRLLRNVRFWLCMCDVRY